MAHISDGQDNHGGLTLLVAGMLIATSGRFAPCQTSSTPPSVTPPIMATPLVQMPTYEVATIKPWDGTGWGTPLRVYIQEAFGIPPNTTGWVIGPAWISSAKYVIQGKPPDAIRLRCRRRLFADHTGEIGRSRIIGQRKKLRSLGRNETRS